MGWKLTFFPLAASKKRSRKDEDSDDDQENGDGDTSEESEVDEEPPKKKMRPGLGKVGSVDKRTMRKENLIAKDESPPKPAPRAKKVTEKITEKDLAVAEKVKNTYGQDGSSLAFTNVSLISAASHRLSTRI